VIADARVALAFLTRLPVGDGRPLDAARLSRAALWFPAVGLLVGGIMGGTRLLADLALEPGPATVLALLAPILVTGALHEDGLADLADGAGAHASRQRKLEIMRDPRVGTYGVLALGLALLLAYAVLSGLDGEHVLRAALAGHVLGRFSTLPQSRWLAPARTDGSGALLRASPLAIGAAGLFAAAVTILAAGAGAGLIALGVAAVLTLAGALFCRRVLGGATGDGYGAVTKVVELGTYAALAAAWG
jgi:adenosylcobinamide-GDP ribazoletransferase